MIRRSATTLIVLVFATAVVASPTPAAFRLVSKLSGTIPTDVPVRVPLPPEVLSVVQSDFADLRLFDNAGRETPYVIYEQVEAHREPASFRFEIVSYEQGEGGEAIILKAPDDAGTYREIELNIDGVDFNLRIEIASGTDGQEWQPLASGAVFDFSSRVDVRNTRVDFPPTHAPFLRLILADSEETERDNPEMRLRYEGLEFWTAGGKSGPFHIDSVLGWSGERRSAAPYLEHVTISDPATELDANGDTIVHLNVRLPVAYLGLDVANTYYYRHVQLLTDRDAENSEYRVAASGVIFKVPGPADAEDELWLDRPIAHVRLKVINEDNPPLQIRGVDIGWVRRNLYFVPEAGQSYALYLGNAEVKSPRYELRKLIPSDHAALASYVEASLSPVLPNPVFDPQGSRSGREAFEKTMLVILIVLVVCGLAVWAYRLLRNLPSERAA
jgi:hypothetical protein